MSTNKGSGASVNSALPKTEKKQKTLRVAIVHDYLAQAGGAERVVEAMHEIWPDAPIYTSVYDADATLSSFKQMDIRTSFLQKWAGSARLHKWALPLYPLAFEQFDLSGYDAVVSSTTGFAKGVITGPETCHVSYCHTPARFAWRYHEYVAQGGYGRMTQRILPLITHHLRNWDYQSAQRVDHFVANSFNTARRIRKFYGRTSDVIHAPVDVSRFQIAARPTADYYLVVARLVGYKRVALAVEAMSRLDLPLKIVGTGPEEARLRALAGPSVQFLGRVADAEVSNLLANCRALLFPGEEDFGITPLEAMACGRPVIAFRAGGALETVADNQTGTFFDELTPDSFIEAVERLESLKPFDPLCLRAHAATFDVKLFQSRICALVENRVAEQRAVYAAISSPAAPAVAELSSSLSGSERRPSAPPATSPDRIETASRRATPTGTEALAR